MTTTAQKMKFTSKYFYGLVTFTEEILNGKLHLLCSVGPEYGIERGWQVSNSILFWKESKQQQLPQRTTTCSKLTIETLKQGLKYVQS